MGGLNTMAVGRERIPLLWSRVRERALTKGFWFWHGQYEVLVPFLLAKQGQLLFSQLKLKQEKIYFNFLLMGFLWPSRKSLEVIQTGTCVYGSMEATLMQSLKSLERTILKKKTHTKKTLFTESVKRVNHLTCCLNLQMLRSSWLDFTLTRKQSFKFDLSDTTVTMKRPNSS